MHTLTHLLTHHTPTPTLTLTHIHPHPHSQGPPLIDINMVMVIGPVTQWSISSQRFHLWSSSSRSTIGTVRASTTEDGIYTV